MKIGLTGHTGAIGSEICKIVDVYGFSKSNGYDITTANGRDKILLAAEELDVFINLANADFGATQLLVDLYSDWKDQKKQIINIGSAIADYNEMREDLDLYAAQKAALKKASKTLGHLCNNCEVKYVSFGYIDTPKMRAKYPEATDIMNTAEVAKIIWSLISNI